MKIAIVAPSPVRFVIGGSENLWLGWQAALNALPGVEAELLKLPSPEMDFWSIVDSYRAFSDLDVSSFDRVISAKYPAWMVAHPDHHVYLLHKLRGLYDMWPPRRSPRVRITGPEVRDLVLACDEANGSREALSEIFIALSRLRNAADQLPRSTFALQGPLMRRVVHTLDAIGLSEASIRRYAVISRTVVKRPDHFPDSLDVGEIEVIHPPAPVHPPPEPSPLVPDGAVFTVSRLDGPKRIDLIIQAYRRSGLKEPLVISGDGPQRAALLETAAEHPGIRFVGRLTDAQLAAAYKSALFVCFVPYQEDFGLVALEALMAGSPVLTCSDAGGVTELVKDGENGLIVEPSVDALAEGMRRLAGDATLRGALGQHAPDSVAHITWPDFARRFAARWPRVAVINTFPVFPAENGGQIRMLHLYRRLARWADLRLVNLAPIATATRTRVLGPGLTEVQVPKTGRFVRYEKRLARKLRASCTDVAAMLRPDLCPEWLAAIDEATRWADAVILCHPYALPALRCVYSGPFVYESLNVEADLKEAIFGHDPETVAAVRAVEARCAREAVLVTCCSPEDMGRMQALYGLTKHPVLVPNGVDSTAYPALSSKERGELRRRLGVHGVSLALFVGSLHGPNLEAVRNLRAIAGQVPEVAFVVVGSVCEAEGIGDGAPPNLHLVGRVGDAELRVWLAAANVGLNPVESGSGTNLKLLEYAAAGLPILSTRFGARGGILQPETHFRVAELAEFPGALREMFGEDSEAAQAARAGRAQARALEAGDWRSIAREYYSRLEACVLET